MWLYEVSIQVLCQLVNQQQPIQHLPTVDLASIFGQRCFPHSIFSPMAGSPASAQLRDVAGVSWQRLPVGPGSGSFAPHRCPAARRRQGSAAGAAAGNCGARCNEIYDVSM